MGKGVTMSSEETPKRKSSLGWILCAAAMVVVFLLGMLAASINERKAEVASIYNKQKNRAHPDQRQERRLGPELPQGI